MYNIHKIINDAQKEIERKEEAIEFSLKLVHICQMLNKEDTIKKELIHIKECAKIIKWDKWIIKQELELLNELKDNAKR